MFFFFKQVTAFEVRIRVWSSDVCSSVLPVFPDGGDQDLEITYVARIYDVPRFRIDDPRLNAGQQSACRPSLRGAVFGIQFGCPTDRRSAELGRAIGPDRPDAISGLELVL